MRKLIPQQMARNGRDESTQPPQHARPGERASARSPSQHRPRHAIPGTVRSSEHAAERESERTSDRAEKGLELFSATNRLGSRAIPTHAQTRDSALLPRSRPPCSVLSGHRSPRPVEQFTRGFFTAVRHGVDEAVVSCRVLSWLTTWGDCPRQGFDMGVRKMQVLFSCLSHVLNAAYLRLSAFA